MNSEVNYRAYLIRIWRIAGDDWRVSLDDPHTGERLAFATLELCMEYLQAVTGAKAQPTQPENATGSSANMPD